MNEIQIQENIRIQTKTGDEIREEARCLEIQDIMATKVIKHGKMHKRKGFLCIQDFKEFEIFLLANGVILFYTLTESSKKYGLESKAHRMQLDETMRIDNVHSSMDYLLEEKVQRFELMIGGKMYKFKTL